MKKKIQKPFDAEAAKRGATIETREGRSVRILCYDRKGNYPIIALINTCKDIESCHSYNIKGKLRGFEDTNEDLVIVEEVEVFKFNVGDYIVLNQSYTYKVNYIDTMYHTYHLVCIDNNSFIRPNIEEVDKNCHKWTIQDAKPGDVLICEDDNCSFIFKEDCSGTPSAYCGIDTNDSIRISSGRNNWTISPVKPATYKERQEFFNRLEEEGYKWDAETLTLSKIQKRWRDDENTEINGYYINDVSRIAFHSGKNACMNYNIFSTKKQAKSALAMARISQIMTNDKRFGDIITDEEWRDVQAKKFIIKRFSDGVTLDRASLAYNFLTFHTKEQAELFLKENEDLIKDYYMMD